VIPSASAPPQETVAGTEPWTEAGAAAPVAAQPVAPATELSAVTGEAQQTGTLVHLAMNGSIESFEKFRVEDPDRLVIDLPGLQMQTPARVQIGTADVATARMGQHEDKVRVVLDASEGATLEDVAVSSGPDGLWVALGGAEAPVVLAAAVVPAALEEEPTAAPEDEPAEAAVEPEAAIAEAAAPSDDEPVASDAVAQASDPDLNQVLGVQYDAQEGHDRVAVVTAEEATFHIMTPAPDTFVVAIDGASLDPEAAVRIAPDPGGAVSLVTAFEQPDVSHPEVRIVVRRAAGLAPEISQEDGMLFLDFPRTGDVAAGLPMLTDSQDGVMLATATADAGSDIVPASLASGDAITMLEEGGLLDGKQYSGRRISLDFKDVDISDVLRLIAEVSDLNIIAGDEVKGEVTIRLVDVPWDQALDVILLTKGLGFVRVGNVLRIAPAGVLQAEEEARLQERRAKEKLEDLLVKLQPVNYADVKEVSKMVSRLLTARGTVDVDQRTNTLIIKDIGSVIDEATALVRAIDTQTPQVLIEAKIVEAALDFTRELGSTWAFGAQPLNDGFDESSGGRQDLGGNDFRLHDNSLLTGFTDTFNHVSVSNPITSVANGLLDVGAFLLDDKLNIELRIEAAESNGEGKVISSPRVVTLDNRTATIEQGLAIPFQTFENGDAKLEFIDAVLKLEVTPHITADRSIIMKIEVQRNAPDDSVQTPTGSPAIAKNEALTETLVKDGQTLVIGGIYTVQKADRSSQVPYFGEIPILGVLFRNSEVRDQRKELLVFVTPRIVVNPELAS
jgi:type IV pilus assembly protein PilQ